MIDYEKKADDFMRQHGITMKARKLGLRKYFADDKLPRWVSRCVFMKANGQRMTMTFGHSINDSWTRDRETKSWRAPSAYDLLSCVETSEPGPLKEWMRELGYDTINSEGSVYDAYHRAYTTHKAVCIAWSKAVKFFTKEQLDYIGEELR